VKEMTGVSRKTAAGATGACMNMIKEDLNAVFRKLVKESTMT
jgi:hypothetical protein